MPTREVGEGAAAPAITIAITTGDNPTLGRAIARMATRGRSDAALEPTGKGQTGTDAFAITIPDGLTVIGTIENAIARSRMHSPAMFTCHVDQSANWFMTVIASTPCADPNRGRSRPSVHSEWSPVVISETKMGARLIHGPATCDTCVIKLSFIRHERGSCFWKPAPSEFLNVPAIVRLANKTVRR